MKKSTILSILSNIVGIFFILSGIGKIVNTGGFAELIQQYGFESLSYFAPLICIGEIALGLFMILLVNKKRYALISFISLFVFTIAFAYAHFIKKVEDCGCFGEISFLKNSPIISFLRDAVLMVFSILIFIFSIKDIEQPKKWKLRVIYFITFLSMGMAGFTMASPLITNIPFKNQQVKNTPLVKYLHLTSDSTYLVFIFRYGCYHCWDATENIKSYVKSKTVDRVVGIAFGDKKSKEIYISNLQPNFQIIPAHTDSGKKLINIFPTAYFIKNNIIKTVMQGANEIVSAYTFKQFFLSPNHQNQTTSK